LNRKLERLISAYLDGEVTPEERREVERALERDPQARRLYEELREVRALLRGLREREAPPDLEESVVAYALGGGARRRGRSWWAGRPALLAAVAAAAAIVLLFPVVRGELNRLRASEVGVAWFVREHTVQTAADPLADRAYLGVLFTDANLALAGEQPRPAQEEPR
jgi:anti-sigma factor RsiW